MTTTRRNFSRQLLALAPYYAAAQTVAGAKSTGMPGPFPGRVVAVHHPASISANTYQAEPVRQMMQKGIRELTGAPSWIDGWRSLFQKGDVVGIKVSPVGGPNLSSDALVLNE